MAASTPSRPFVCVVPTRECVILAEELAGLGGSNDIALAEVTAVVEEDVVESAINLARWAQDGFSATIAAFAQERLDQAGLLVLSAAQAISEEAGPAILGLTWTVVGHSSARDPLSRPIQPLPGLRGAATIALDDPQQIQPLLKLAQHQQQQQQRRQRSQSDHLIIALHVYNTDDATLSSLNCIVAAPGDDRLAFLDMLGEVAGLHARRCEGDNILRSARLSLLNQLAAPLIAGNVRLCIVADQAGVGGGDELMQAASHIRAVCTRTVFPQSQLQWQPYADFAAKAAHEQQQQRRRQEDCAAPEGSSSGVMSDSARKLRDKLRLRASASLQQAAARAAAQGKKGRSGKGGGGHAGDDDATSQASSHPPSQRSVSFAQPADASHEESAEFKGPPAAGSSADLQQCDEGAAASSLQPAGSADDGGDRAAHTTPSAATSVPEQLKQRFNSLYSATVEDSPGAFSQAGPAPDAHVASDTRGADALDDAGLHAARVRVQARTAALFDQHASLPAAAAPRSMAWRSIEAAAAAFSPSLAELGPSALLSSSPGRLPQGGATPVNSRTPASGAPAADIFTSQYLAELPRQRGGQGPPVQDFTAQLDGGDDPHQQAAAAPGAVRGYADSYLQLQQRWHYPPEQQGDAYAQPLDPGLDEAAEYSSVYEVDLAQQQQQREKEEQQEEPHPHQRQQPAFTLHSALAELDQERRVNSVLLQQMQEAQQRAATAERAAAAASASAAAATASAAATIAVEDAAAIDLGDFDGVVAALHRERRRSTAAEQRAQRAEEQQLELEVEMNSSRREAAISRARCRAWERESPLASMFQQAEAQLGQALQEAERLKRESAGLARALADREVDALVLPAQATLLPDAETVIADMHRRLLGSQARVKKLEEQLAASRAEMQAAQRQVRQAEVHRVAAENAVRRTHDLHAALTRCEAQLQAQSLAAAEAAGRAEQLQTEAAEHQRQAAGAEEKCLQLQDLVGSLRSQVKVLRLDAGREKALRCLTIND